MNSARPTKVITVEQDRVLSQINFHFSQMTGEVLRQLDGMGYPIRSKSPFPTAEMKDLLTRLETGKGLPYQARARSLAARYFKIEQCAAVALCESYGRFTALARELSKHAEPRHGEGKPSRAALDIVTDGGFRHALELARRQIEEGRLHPKLDELVARCSAFHAEHGRGGIIFVGEGHLGDDICQALKSRGLCGELVTGRHKFNGYEHQLAARKFLSGQAQFLVTSVLERPTLLPNVQAALVVSYVPPASLGSLRNRVARLWGKEPALSLCLLTSDSPDLAYFHIGERARRKKGGHGQRQEVLAFVD